jgi:large subunit ribosomal protein L29
MPSAAELRELDDEELEGRLSEYRRELLNLRFQSATGQLDNVARIPTVRRDLARVLTILRDREIALAEGRDAGPVISSRPARRRAELDEGEDVQERPRARRASRQAEVEAADAADEVDEDTDEVDEVDVVEDDGADGADDEADEEET